MSEQIIDRVVRALTPPADGATSDEILPRVYEQLRAIAGRRIASLSPGQTLDATALVHEAWLRLRKPGVEQVWDSDRHFFGAAAQSMQRVLVDVARRRRTLKRGLGVLRIAFSDDLVTDGRPGVDAVDVLALDQALEALRQHSGLGAELVSLRFFAGLTMPEIADVLGLSISQVEKEWYFVRAWLRVRLDGDECGQ